MEKQQGFLPTRPTIPDPTVPLLLAVTVSGIAIITAIWALLA